MTSAVSQIYPSMNDRRLNLRNATERECGEGRLGVIMEETWQADPAAAGDEMRLRASWVDILDRSCVASGAGIRNRRHSVNLLGAKPSHRSVRPARFVSYRSSGVMPACPASAWCA